MKFSIEKKTIDEIVNYLAQKPFREVVHLMKMLNEDCKPMEDIKKEDPPAQGV